MDKDEEKVYKSLKNDLVLDLQGQEITASSAATLCMKLTQLSSGAIYSDDGGVVKVYDRKLDALEDIIEASCGKSLLVAYYFKHDLIRIEERSRLVLFILKVVVWV